MTTVIDPKLAWSHSQAAAFAILVAATSVLGIWAVAQLNEAMDYELPGLVFIPLFLGLGLGYPVAVTAISYKRLFPVTTLLVFIVAYAIGWNLVFFTCQTVDLGPWTGLSVDERTLLRLLAREGLHLGVTLAVSLVVGWLTWGVCRIVRGRPVVQDGTLCGKCGYSLIGNVSGRCPECGTSSEDRKQHPELGSKGRVPVWTSPIWIVLAGCFAWAAYSHRLTPTTKARAYVQAWSRAGMNLPKTRVVALFVDNYDELRPVLLEGLAHPEDEVRTRAAYVIDGIGHAASDMAHELVELLRDEDVRLVRVYLLNALRSIGEPTHEVLDAIRERFSPAQHLEERLYAAAALFCLTDLPGEREEAEAFVYAFLTPDQETKCEVTAEEYWDLRWSAVNAVQHMKGASKAIPLLEQMLVEPNAKPWVEIQVPRALAALRKAAQESG